MAFAIPQVCFDQFHPRSLLGKNFCDGKALGAKFNFFGYFIRTKRWPATVTSETKED